MIDGITELPTVVTDTDVGNVSHTYVRYMGCIYSATCGIESAVLHTSDVARQAMRFCYNPCSQATVNQLTYNAL